MNPYNIILVFPKQKFDQAETVCYELSQKLQKQGQKPRLDQVWNEAEALQRCKDSPKHYDLMITSLDIPANRKIPLKSAEQRGIALMKSMRKNNIGIPCILLAEYKDEQLDAAIGKCKPCRAVETRVGNWESELIIKCQASLLEREQDKHNKEKGSVLPESKGKEGGRVDIILEVSDGLICYCMQGENVDITPKLLHIDVKKLMDLRKRSNNVSLLEDWESELHAIGYDLRYQFSHDSEFEQDITKTILSCGGPENVRIRFVVDKMIHPVAVEALLDQKEEYYMLYSPTYRTIQMEGVRSPLFADNETREKPINCLIIEANTSGRVLDIKDSQGEELELEHLVNVRKESREIKKYLTTNKAKFKIGEIGHLTQSSKKQSYFDRMEDALTEHGPWHLVHFAGHSYYDKANDTGYIFVPGPTGPKAVSADGFAMNLRLADTRFVYLSSCKSGGADFVYELAKKEIPSILGFRWDIEDAEAAEHAQLFYKNLFDEEKILEYAFFRTRTKMYSRHPGHRIWCAAMLIIQKKV